MAAVDGAFDTTIEAVEATIDANGLSAGRHIVFVRGQDAAGNWGPVSARFVYLLQPGVSPMRFRSCCWSSVFSPSAIP